jgi:RNA polymerase sigma-70 factor, ECF subfamily
VLVEVVEPDEDLYSKAVRGDLVAFERLYARHERRLFGFVLRLLENRAEAEEAFHDTFVNLLNANVVRFEEARFAAWLYRIARNVCANRLRSRARGEAALAWVEREGLPGPSPEELLVREEQSHALARAVARLPAGFADVFHLRSSGLSYEEIASVLEVPLGTVKSRMNALVQKLQGELT